MTPANEPSSQPHGAASAGLERNEVTASIGVHYDTKLPDLPWSRRIQIPFIAALVYLVICILGPTLRFEVLGWQNAENVYASGRR